MFECCRFAPSIPQLGFACAIIILKLLFRFPRKSRGHDLSEFYEGGLEKGGFSKLNLRKVRRRPGGGGWRLEKGFEGGLEKGGPGRAWTWLTSVKN